MSNNILGNAIRRARMSKNLTQEGLAELIGITPIHLKHIEGGQGNPSVPVLFKLAKTLELSIDSIIAYDSNDSRNENDENTESLKANINYMLVKCSSKELNLILDIINDIIKNRDKQN